MAGKKLRAGKISEQYKHSDLNIIFYGPPGTGKTYNTIKRAAEIIKKTEEIPMDEEAKKIFNQELGKRIEFITFHQNYSYEDFVQGLRPDIENDKTLTFEQKDGIFMRMSVNALFEYYKQLKKGVNSQKKDDINEIYIDFIEYLKNQDEKSYETISGAEVLITSFTKNNNIEYKHKDRNRRYIVSRERLLKLYTKFPDIDDVKNVYTDIIETIGGCNATVYWVALKEFIKFYNELRKDKDTFEHNYEDMSYETKKKLLSTIGLDELNTIPAGDVDNYVLIIDEINRANISRVFGELIALIEPDKRSHGDIPLVCKLPSGEDFIVPSNLYIIGTMNTADKSIALVDIALRRRFVFEAYYPVYEIDEKSIPEHEILEKINAKIVELKGYDFQIGHSFFMEIDKIRFDNVMNRKVIPMLLEYFMNKKEEVIEVLRSAGLENQLEKDNNGNHKWPLRVER